MKHIKDVFEEEITYIQNRYDGKVKSMTTPFPCLNRAGIDGLEWGTITTIGAMSGGGKTSILGQVFNEVHSLNPAMPIAALFFTLEMEPRKLVGRTISYTHQQTVQELYTNKDPSHQILINNIRNNMLPNFSNKLIWYEDIPRTPSQTRDIIEKFAAKYSNHYILIGYDNTSLTKREPSFDERNTIIELYSQFNELKKLFPRSLYIVLSQLNRDIEDVKRKTTASLHYPQKSDIFGSDAPFTYSDIFVMFHDPHALHIKKYGPHEWPTQGLVFAHFIKVRDGQKDAVGVFHNQLKYNTLVELTIQERINLNIK